MRWSSNGCFVVGPVGLSFHSALVAPLYVLPCPGGRKVAVAFPNTRFGRAGKGRPLAQARVYPSPGHGKGHSHRLASQSLVVPAVVCGWTRSD